MILGFVMFGGSWYGFCYGTKAGSPSIYDGYLNVLVSLVTIMQYQVLLQCDEELSRTSMARYELSCERICKGGYGVER